MFYLIFSLILAVIALFRVLSGIRKGKKYVWGYSVTQIVVAILSAILAAFLSAGVSLLFFDLIFSSAVETGGNMAELLKDLPIMTEAIRAIAAMIVAPMLYYVIFFVLRTVLGLVAKIVLRAILKKASEKKKASSEDGKIWEEVPIEEDEVGKKRKKKKKSKEDGYFRISSKKNPWGRLCGALCGLIVFLATMIPAVGMIGIVNDMTSWALADVEIPVVQTVVSIVDAGDNNVVSKTVRAVGGDALYSVMTTYEVDGEKATLAKETKLLGVMGRALADMTNPEVERAEAAESFREIDEAFSDTALIPSVLPEFLNSAKESWDRGEEYCGVEKPSFGKMDGLVHPILDLLGTSTKQTIREDVGTLVDLTAYMIEHDTMTDVKDDPMTIFEKQEVTAEVMYELLKNDHLAPLVGDLANFGLQMFGEALNSPMTAVEMNSTEIEDPKKESEALALALSEMASMTKQLTAGSFNSLDSIKSMGPMLDSFAATETIGEENTAKILESILTSNQISSITNVGHERSLELAEKITQEASSLGYEVALNKFFQDNEILARFQY